MYVDKIELEQSTETKNSLITQINTIQLEVTQKQSEVRKLSDTIESQENEYEKNYHTFTSELRFTSFGYGVNVCNEVY